MADQTAESSAVKASFVLLGATIAALVVANSGMAGAYKSVLGVNIGYDIGPFDLSFSLKDWIKNALMAIFFVFVGLEIKAEFQEGSLADRQRATLPFVGAIGGMAMPAIIYLFITKAVPGLEKGWAIPSATDIAFAVGVVGLLGAKVSAPLRAFLLAVAVIDDLGAILVIAVFYTGALKAWALLGMLVATAILAALNSRAEARIWPYMVVGAVLWLFTLQSGINATLAGVVTALFVPLNVDGTSPLHRLVDRLKTPVNFAIMPIFAFANAGVPLFGLGIGDLMKPLTAGIALGLILGKPVGIAFAVYASVRLNLAKLPDGATWLQIAGIGCLAGIGFTMSLFIGALAFNSDELLNQVRLGVLSGSLVSGILGAAILIASHSAHSGQARKKA